MFYISIWYYLHVHLGNSSCTAFQRGGDPLERNPKGDWSCHVQIGEEQIRLEVFKMALQDFEISARLIMRMNWCEYEHKIFWWLLSLKTVQRLRDANIVSTVAYLLVQKFTQPTDHAPETYIWAYATNSNSPSAVHIKSVRKVFASKTRTTTQHPNHFSGCFATSISLGF